MYVLVGSIGHGPTKASRFSFTGVLLPPESPVGSASAYQVSLRGLKIFFLIRGCHKLAKVTFINP